MAKPVDLHGAEVRERIRRAAEELPPLPPDVVAILQGPPEGAISYLRARFGGGR